MIWAYLLTGVVILFIVSHFQDIHQHKKGVQVENIRARLMLLSTSIKEIEAFLLAKEPYITQELISQLIARIVELKLDDVIANDDDFLKKRIANLREPDELDEPVNFGKVMIEREKERR